jgi:hypothetical protein
VPQDSKNNNMKKSQLADQSDQLSHGPITKRQKKRAELTWQGAQSCRERAFLAAEEKLLNENYYGLLFLYYDARCA